MPIEKELGAYLQMLLRYRWVILACAIIAGGVAFGISSQLTPLYSATATVRVASAPGGASDYTYTASATRLSNTYVEIATSEVSLNKVMERLALQTKPSVQVDVVPETELIQIAASDTDPAQARDIANTLAGLMVEQSMELYGGNAPTAREILEAQLQQAKTDLDSAVSKYDTALRSGQLIATPQPNVVTIPDPDVETLARIVNIRQQIYGDLLQQYETARTNEQLRANAITIVEPADLPLKPATPRTPLNTALGLVAGFAIGVILAFLFEGMDDTVRGIEDIQGITTLPILSQVPELKPRLNSNLRFKFSQAGHLPFVPAFTQLCARMLLFAAKPKSTTFIITSPEPEAGKSTIAANLAASLSEQGNKVVLVDMDLHCPRLHSIFGIPNEMGLSNFLKGEIEFDAMLHPTTISNLRVVVAGSSPDFSSEWLAPTKIGSLLKLLEKECNYLLIDTAALLSVADPMVLASQVDAVILVVAERKTGRQNLLFALRQLSELKIKIAGIVLNRVANSQLYSYYSEQNLKRLSSREGNGKKRILIDAHSLSAHKNVE